MESYTDLPDSFTNPLVPIIEVKASVLTDEKTLRVIERDVTDPEPHELQIAIKRTGICGSDQHYYKDYENAGNKVREHLTLGHESSGVVLRVGKQVDTFEPGDRVALEVGIACDKCKYCAKNLYNLCVGEMRFRSSAKLFPHEQGTLQEALNHPAKWVYKLPDAVTLEEGSLIEPLSVAIHAVNRANMKDIKEAEVGSAGGKVQVLIIGAGAIGLLTAAVLRVEGGCEITMADVVERRLGFAKENGFADHTVVVPLPDRLPPGQTQTKEEKTASDLKFAEKVVAEKLTGTGKEKRDYGVVFECAGVPSATMAAIRAAAPGSKVVLVGLGPIDQTIPLGSAMQREVDIVGVFRYRNTYQKGIDMIANRETNGIPDISKIITHTYKEVENVEEAFKMGGRAVDDEGKLVLKVMIEFDRDLNKPVDGDSWMQGSEL
ncbi:GroES-like protein [Xylariaceae sp. FL0594]|nr:GroES-like protein [Xylariaceae sp. FL0594]